MDATTTARERAARRRVEFPEDASARRGWRVREKRRITPRGTRRARGFDDGFALRAGRSRAKTDDPAIYRALEREGVETHPRRRARRRRRRRSDETSLGADRATLDSDPERRPRRRGRAREDETSAGKRERARLSERSRVDVDVRPERGGASAGMRRDATGFSRRRHAAIYCLSVPTATRAFGHQ
jgi:hypothetical protein